MVKSKIRKISKKCIVCGKRINLTLYSDKNYRGGYYFGTMELPFGKGEYKDLKTTKLFGKKIKITKWTGKKRKVEYWECYSCYEEGQNESWLEDIIGRLYGKRCKDYNKGCGCCKAWEVYDMIIDYSRGRL
ncbi:hypothetical protein J4414_00555 [Candidatus Woesearchaeota archaeon]|nr:hypothetical protein [Candidatus Woesearchaeota archaeon]